MSESCLIPLLWITNRVLLSKSEPVWWVFLVWEWMESSISSLTPWRNLFCECLSYSFLWIPPRQKLTRCGHFRGIPSLKNTYCLAKVNTTERDQVLHHCVMLFGHSILKESLKGSEPSPVTEKVWKEDDKSLTPFSNPFGELSPPKNRLKDQSLTP